jgi:hypothetical protein
MTTAGSPTLSHDKLLIYIPEDRKEDWILKVESAHPGIQVQWCRSITPEGTLVPFDQLAPEVWDGLTMFCGFFAPPATLLNSLRFVQLTSAGADKWVQHEKYKDQNIMFCTSNGIHG